MQQRYDSIAKAIISRLDASMVRSSYGESKLPGMVRDFIGEMNPPRAINRFVPSRQDP